jgi:hypothetical protein
MLSDDLYFSKQSHKSVFLQRILKLAIEEHSKSYWYQGNSPLLPIHRCCVFKATGTASLKVAGTRHARRWKTATPY